jgi:hypothetical protein
MSAITSQPRFKVKPVSVRKLVPTIAFLVFQLVFLHYDDFPMADCFLSKSELNQIQDMMRKNETFTMASSRTEDNI